MASITLNEVHRILDRIELNEHRCMHWPTKRSPNILYTVIRIEGIGQVKVSRLALEHKLGRPIKPGYLALHTCDYPPCINPNHLYEGTRKENMRDYALRHSEKFQKHLKKIHTMNCKLWYNLYSE